MCICLSNTFWHCKSKGVRHSQKRRGCSMWATQFKREVPRGCARRCRDTSHLKTRTLSIFSPFFPCGFTMTLRHADESDPVSTLSTMWYHWNTSSSVPRLPVRCFQRSAGCWTQDLCKVKIFVELSAEKASSSGPLKNKQNKSRTLVRWVEKCIFSSWKALPWGFTWTTLDNESYERYNLSIDPLSGKPCHRSRKHHAEGHDLAANLCW